MDPEVGCQVSEGSCPLVPAPPVAPRRHLQVKAPAATPQRHRTPTPCSLPCSCRPSCRAPALTPGRPLPLLLRPLRAPVPAAPGCSPRCCQHQSQALGILHALVVRSSAKLQQRLQPAPRIRGREQRRPRVHPRDLGHRQPPPGRVPGAPGRRPRRRARRSAQCCSSSRKRSSLTGVTRRQPQRPVTLTVPYFHRHERR